MKKKTILLPLIALLGLASCSYVAPYEVATIVFTNDIHSHIDNKKDDNIALRLSKVGAYVDALKAKGKNTLLVDAGDSIQGSVYGTLDNGESIIELMNKAGYDLSIPGNHDFDYKVDTFLNLTKKANFDFISCNFVSLPNKEKLLAPTKIFQLGNKKIGFVGISTPETLTTSTPTFFQDGNGNWIYDFLGSEDPKYLYEATQQAVDSIKNEVDWVIALGHLGVESLAEKNGISSINVIKNTTGIDAFIDAHSHTLVEGKEINNKDNKPIRLYQTGSYLDRFGELRLYSDHTISLSLRTTYVDAQIDTANLENNLISQVEQAMGKQIAINDNKFYVNNPDKPKQRLIRAREMNSGDLVSDSYYWYLNEYKGLECDAIIQNGGGIRTELEVGNVTLKNLKNILPFNNVVCLIEATGQDIKDALEMGVTIVDKWDDNWDCPAENGGFLHVGGLTYTVDCSIPSKVVTNEKGMFVKVDGEYRTKDIKIYNKKTNSFDDLDLTKTYRLGGINYILRNSGNGLSMFADNKLIVDYLETDFQVFASYIANFAKVDQYPHISTTNSPLAKYTNYKIDYANPYGAKRINIINLPKSN